MISSALVLILIISAFGIFILVRKTQMISINEGNFQRDASIILARIIKGTRESGGIYRLSEAASYQINSISDMTFTCADGSSRRYYLNGDSTSLLYQSGNSPSYTTTVYTAPAGAVITLRFWTPSGDVYTNTSMGIDVAVSQPILDRTVSGSVTTLVNIRNHST